MKNKVAIIMEINTFLCFLFAICMWLANNYKLIIK